MRHAWPQAFAYRDGSRASGCSSRSSGQTTGARRRGRPDDLRDDRADERTTGPDRDRRHADAAWQALADVGAGLTEEDWKTPTDLPGWSVQDTLSHVIGTERLLEGLPAPDRCRVTRRRTSATRSASSTNARSPPAALTGRRCPRRVGGAARYSQAHTGRGRRRVLRTADGHANRPGDDDRLPRHPDPRLLGA